MSHFVTKFFHETFQVRFEPPAEALPLDPTGAAPRTPAPPSTCTPSPVPPTTRMPAIIKFIQAANFHVLIG